MASNIPPGYSDDGDAVTHGSDTAMYQELLPIKAAFDKWADQFGSEFYGPDMKKLVDEMEIEFETLVEQINQPL